MFYFALDYLDGWFVLFACIDTESQRTGQYSGCK